MKKILFGLIMILGIAIALTPVYGGPITLKAVTFLPKNDKNLVGWKAFIEDVNKKAKGELEIKYVGGPEAVPGFKQFDAVRSGVVQMIFGCESYYGRQVTGAAYTHLTRLNPIQEREVGYLDVRADILKKHGVKYLGRPCFGAWFHIFTNNPIKRPKEIKGQKIRVSATYEAFVKRLGAVPVSMPGSDVYTALERGTIDGYAWAVIGNVQFGWVDVCKYILEPRIYEYNLEMLLNLQAWEKIPGHLQKIMSDSMIENEKKYSKVIADLAEKEYLEMQKKGVKVIKFSPEDTKWYIDFSYEAGWDEVIKQNPTLGPKLKKLLSP